MQRSDFGDDTSHIPFQRLDSWCVRWRVAIHAHSYGIQMTVVSLLRLFGNVFFRNGDVDYADYC
jgi:hypothetical protein